MLDLAGKDFRGLLINTFKELQEKMKTRSRESHIYENPIGIWVFHIMEIMKTQMELGLWKPKWNFWWEVQCKNLKLTE